ncbi:MAG TPA: hypothetical protein VHU80_24375 [Polyangiaceae bacterium]|nr:hypothetical protein [Polyangiaceae bacterium]
MVRPHEETNVYISIIHSSSPNAFTLVTFTGACAPLREDLERAAYQSHIL